MQKKTLRYSILGSMVLIISAMLAFLGVFLFGQKPVSAEVNMGAIKATIITVDNKTNNILSEREIIFDDVDESGNPFVYLDSYTELSGAKIEGSTLTYYDGEINQNSIGTTIDGITSYDVQVNGTNGVAYYSETLKKVFWFKTKPVVLNLTINETNNTFSYTYNGVSYTEEYTTLENGSPIATTHTSFGNLLGTISNYDSSTKTAVWTSNNVYASHEAVQIKISEAGGNYYIDQYEMTYNGNLIGSNGTVPESIYSYYYKEYHGLPASIIDDFGISSSAYTKENNNSSSNNLESLEGKYDFKAQYRIEQGTGSGAGDIIEAEFIFYLTTSNTYSNTNELLNFYNVNSVLTTASQKDHYFAFNNILTNNLFDFDAKVLDDASLLSGTLSYNNGEQIVAATPITLDVYYQVIVNGVRGLAYKDSKTDVWMWTDKLLYPTISYNPEKYSISFEKTFYSYIENYVFDFVADDDLYGTLTLSKINSTGSKTQIEQKTIYRKTEKLTNFENLNILNDELISFDYDSVTYTALNGKITLDDKTYYYNKVLKTVCEYNLDAPFIAYHTFNEIGDYALSQQYMLKIADGTYYKTDGINATTGSIQNISNTIHINGYQAIYRDNGTDVKFLNNENFYSDFSYLLTEASGSSAVFEKATSLSYSEGELTISSSKIYINTEKLVSTNQTPVTLRYNATKNTAANSMWYVYVNDYGTIEEVNDYTNSVSFSTAGLYFVFLSFKNNASDDNYVQQVLAFRITNFQPVVSIKATTETNSANIIMRGENELVSKNNRDPYTNKNVFIEWLKNNEFDTTITATYDKFDFNGTKIISNAPLRGLVYDKNGEITQSNPTLFSENGKYVVRINYATISSTTRVFTIDKTSISGITAYSVDSENKANNVLSSQSDFNLAVKDPFVWSWDEKASGANITASYYYSNLTAKPDFELKKLLYSSNNNEIWVTANGMFSDLKKGPDYAYTNINNSFELEQIISSNCLAILLLEDEAGNTASFVTIYDSIAPEIIQERNGVQTTTELINTTTKFTWGAYKALDASQVEDVLKNLTTSIEIDDNTYSLNQTISNALKSYFRLSSTSAYCYTQKISKAEMNERTFSGQSAYVVITNNNDVYNAYISENENPSGTAYDLTNNINLSVSAYDNINNRKTLSKNISLDKSDGRIFSHSEQIDISGISDTTNGDINEANRQRLSQDMISNRDFLTFSFKQESSGSPFEVERITLSFYELTYQEYDSNSNLNANYPYSSTPIEYTLYTNTGNGMISSINWTETTSDDTEATGTYYQSSALNIGPNGLTIQGKYVFKRYYASESAFNANSNGDVFARTYIAFVDRSINPMLETKLKLGEIIDGYTEQESTKIFNSFGNQSNAKKDFNINTNINVPAVANINTNMVPATISLLSEFKYNNQKLLVIIQEFNSSRFISQTLFSPDVQSSSLSPDGKNIIKPFSLLSSSFNKVGVYRVIVCDYSNLASSKVTEWNDLTLWNNSIFVPNVLVFSFQINNTTPQIEIQNSSTHSQLKMANLTSNVSGTYAYTNNDNYVVFKFSDTIDAFSARIAYKSWILTRTSFALNNDGIMTALGVETISPSNYTVREYDLYNPENNEGVFSPAEIQRINGTYSGEDFTNFSLYNGILYYKVKISGVDRYDYYIILPKNSGNIDCFYSLTINYIGTANSYQNLSFSKTESVYIDNISPYKVLLNLIENDTYLTDLQKAEMKNNLNNHNYEFLKYYAFNVGSSFNVNNFSSLDSSDKGKFYYYKKVDDKYDGTLYPNQTVIPESDDYNTYTNLRFSRDSFSSNEYINQITVSGYYDVVEVDDAGNHRVYTICITEENNEVLLNAAGSNFLNDSLNFRFSSTTGDNGEKTYIIKETTSNTTYDTTTTPSLSVTSFVLNSNNFKINDSWYKVSFSLENGTINPEFLNNYVFNVAPQNYLNAIRQNQDLTDEQKESILNSYKTKNEIIEFLNDLIEDTIALNSTLNGTQIRLIFNNRSGKDIDFYLLTPGKEISISELYPERVGDTLFRITMPADSYSTKYSDFEIRRNASQLQYDNSSPQINLFNLNTSRTSPTILSFAMFEYNYKYTFNFKDNFGRTYKFTYPTAEGMINGVVYENGSTPTIYNGITYTPNTTLFNYRIGGDDRISIKIYDADSDTVILDEKDLVYTTYGVENSLVNVCNMNSQYISQSLDSQTSIVTISFNAIKNRHLIYEIVLIDIDYNKSTYNFGIYTYAPTVTLTDTSGTTIWASNILWDNSIQKITSKSVQTLFATNTDLLFNPKVYIVKDSIMTPIITGYISRSVGEYSVIVKSDLGVINICTINFTIKEATSDLYSVYFADEKLSPHTTNNYRYRYEFMNGSDNAVKYIYNYFFLSDSNVAWNDIKILPSEEQDLEVKYLETQGNTRIYEISNENLTTYCAITQVHPVQNNNLTTLTMAKSSTGDFSNVTPITSISKQTVYPQTSGGNPTYVKLSWNKTEAGIENFVYLYIIYNDSVVMGRVSEDIVLTRSGKYTIQVYDVVGQVHRFGDKDTFTLLILNEINYYINNKSPIQNATYNDEVNLSLVDTADFDWKNSGRISVMKNNAPYTDFRSAGTSWTFWEAGYYKVTISVSLRNSSTQTVVLSATAQFTILDPNEAKTVYDFAKTSGYYVSTIQKITYTKDDESEQIIENYEDITNELKQSLNVNKLENFKLSPQDVDAGRYLITVTVNSSLMVEEQYSFVVWINDEIFSLLSPSRSWGSSSTKSFRVQYNPSNIFEQVGNCYIKVNGNIVATIDENNSQNTKASFSVTEVGTHIVQIYSKSGSLISSQRITITKPLNTAAIILIVVGVLVVIGIIVLFVMFRTKMKVK